jgi:glycosyltransferase involved in cell wall biosynthesis
MKNILFVSHSSELNGAELWLFDILKRLDRGIYAPFLIVPRPGRLAEAAKEIGVETRAVPMKWWITEKSRIWRQPIGRALNGRNVGRIAKIIAEKKIDLVFTNSAAVNAGAKAAARMGVPHVWAVHEVLGGANPFLFHIFGRRALANFIVKSSARIIVNSEISKAAFPNAPKVVLVYNGMEMKSGDEGRPETLRREFGIREGDLVAGIVGKLYAGKGQRETIMAAALLKSSFPRLKWLIVGEARDARYHRRLKNLVKDGGLDDRVIFTGYRPDLIDVLKIMDVLVVASVVESFGRVALEAMAAGVPVLAVRAGGLPEIVRHGQNGFLLDSRDPRVIALGLEYIFQNPDKAKEAVAGGRRTILERFTLERQIREVERVLDESLV